jgi:hypothetical protein
MERWVQTCRFELLDRTLIWNQFHLLHALSEFEGYYNQHRHPASCTARRYGQLPSRSPNQTDSTSSTFAEETDSAAYSTNTNMPHELHGRNFRHPQRRMQTKLCPVSTRVCHPRGIGRRRGLALLSRRQLIKPVLLHLPQRLTAFSQQMFLQLISGPRPRHRIDHPRQQRTEPVP